MHRITEVRITTKAAAYGVSREHFFALLFGLINEHQAEGERLLEPHYSLDFSDQGPLTAVGIFEPGKECAQVCICLYDELEEGRASSFGRELLYPRKAEIAVTLSPAAFLENRPCRIEG